MIGLEHLNSCPVCGESERTPAYLQVEDRVFGTPGKWDYWSCQCGVLYLDPRPAKRAIGAVYANYYTHSEEAGCLPWREPGLKGRVRRAYLNGAYGYRFADASLLARVAFPTLRRAATSFGFAIRHLPPPRGGERVLDLGCGNGDFLEAARDLGYQAVGLDPDPRAVEVAVRRGLDARLGSIPGTGEPPESFDHVLLNHVLEHLHDPVAALRETLSLLVPGGRLWLSQPNLCSLGLSKFGEHWRGLEPPRHLTLFGPARLAALLNELGFADVQLLGPVRDAAVFYFRQSQSIACGTDPYAEEDPSGWTAVRKAAVLADRRARSSPLLAETLTMTALRPAA